jgi:hypothetical protein
MEDKNYRMKEKKIMLRVRTSLVLSLRGSQAHLAKGLCCENPHLPMRTLLPRPSIAWTVASEAKSKR